MKSKVLLVDDHPVVRFGLANMIDAEPDLTVCGHAEDLGSALEAITATNPDIVILDISLNGPSGLELLKLIRETDLNLRVLVLSMHDEMVYAERALHAGANGYLMKQEATETVLLALRRILAGDIYVSEEVTRKVLERSSGGSSAAPRSPLDVLTDREMEVFRLTGEGRGTREISDQLHLSAKTIETYQAHIREKLGLRNARELLQRAIQWNIAQGQRINKMRQARCS